MMPASAARVKSTRRCRRGVKSVLPLLLLSCLCGSSRLRLQQLWLIGWLFDWCGV